MGDFLDFLLEATEKFGLLTALLLAASVAVGGYVFRTYTKKDKLLKDLVEKQQEQTVLANENTQLAIQEIKELSVLTIQEVTRLSGELNATIDIVKTLLSEHLKNGRDREVD
jgi:hypothetical protein